jgi:hypothetical protein
MTDDQISTTEPRPEGFLLGSARPEPAGNRLLGAQRVVARR